MSSSGPYQSRLFNLLNRHRIRWSDRVTQAVRQIQVATEWGVQTLLYPIYLIVQMGRSTRQQLEQQVYSSAALPAGSQLELDTQLQYCAVDAPIEQVLQAVNPWLSEGNEENTKLEEEQTNIWGKLGKFVPQLLFNSPKKSKTRWFRHQNKALELTSDRLPQQGETLSNLAIGERQSLLANVSLDKTNSLPQRDKKVLTIQGIASLVESRVLVLVTQDNHILDILTSQQQQQLQQRIIQSLAAYRPHRSFLKTATKKILQILPNFSSEDSKALPPVRFAWDIINWIQTSPVALKANLFGESSLVSVSSESTEISYKRCGSSRKAGSPLAELSIILDRALAGLETQSQNLVTFVDRTINNLPIKINQTDTLKQRQSPGENLNTAREHCEPDPFQLQVLIKAAIDYFFGNAYGNVASSNLPHSSNRIPLKPTTSSPSLPTASPEDPWLSWSDLFNDTLSSPTIAQTFQKVVTLQGDSDKKSLPETARKPTNSRQWSRSRIKSRLQLPKSRALFVVASEITDVTLKQQEHSTLNTTNAEVISSFSSSQPTPDWVETDATALGYVKHPLEILLELLDRIILWLEELALKIWRQLKRLKAFSR